jgi:hypothetical protein
MSAPIQHGEWLENDLEEYWNVLQASKLADKSVEDYYYFAMCFVRWVNGTFIPGDKVK